MHLVDDLSQPLGVVHVAMSTRSATVIALRATPASIAEDGSEALHVAACAAARRELTANRLQGLLGRQ